MNTDDKAPMAVEDGFQQEACGRHVLCEPEFFALLLPSLLCFISGKGISAKFGSAC